MWPTRPCVKSHLKWVLPDCSKSSGLGFQRDVPFCRQMKLKNDPKRAI